MLNFALAAALAVTTQVASPERQKELLAQIHAKQAAASAPVVGFETLPPGFVGPPKPIVASPAVSPPKYSDSSTHSAPSRSSQRRASYRAHNARVAREQAAQAAAAKAEFQRNLPYLLEMNRQQSNLQIRQYEAQLRHRENMDFNDAVRGVTRPR